MDTKDQIIRELGTTLELLGAESFLRAIIYSYGDTLTDDEVLSMLREWNARQTKKPG